MKTYALTGIGPQNTVTGDVPLYTVRPQPFIATKEWLAEQSKYPEMGDSLLVHENGDHVLITEAQALSDEAAGLTVNQTITDDAQKKSLGVDDSDNGSENSHAGHNLALLAFKHYHTEPLNMHAAAITAVVPTVENDHYDLSVSTNEVHNVGPESYGEMPSVGDYLMQIDGDEYFEVVPKAHFEAIFFPTAE